MSEEVQAEIRGRDMVTGLPKTVVLTSEEIRAALEEPVSQIIDAIKETLDGRRRSWPPTSWIVASCWPEAARCYRGWRSDCVMRRRCPCTWRSRR